MTESFSRHEPVSLAVVILAAGESKRMKSSLTKVLHPLGGIPMILHVIRSVQTTNPDHMVVVVGKNRGPIEKALDGCPVILADQKIPLGTAHALLSASAPLGGFHGDLLVLCGDTPLIRPRTLSALIDYHRNERGDATLLTCRFDDPHGYGRIIRNREGGVEAIVEEVEATEYERAVREINTGIYCFKSPMIFRHLEEICSGPTDHEFYLTDIVAMYNRKGLRVRGLSIEDESEVMGINTPEQLASAEDALNKRT
jgi:bifunctional UDP-N-acetylglucosamine pyrophosphorylase/glucosamine-1-phosphate N-acetyltransferase